jgi:hypothetical protein
VVTTGQWDSIPIYMTLTLTLIMPWVICGGALQMEGFSDLLGDLLELLALDPRAPCLEDLTVQLAFLLRNLAFLRGSKARVLSSRPLLDFLVRAFTQPSLKVRSRTHLATPPDSTLTSVRGRVYVLSGRFGTPRPSRCGRCCTTARRRVRCCAASSSPARWPRRSDC